MLICICQQPLPFPPLLPQSWLVSSCSLGRSIREVQPYRDEKEPAKERSPGKEHGDGRSSIAPPCLPACPCRPSGRKEK